jgi:hypothetical protein
MTGSGMGCVTNDLGKNLEQIQMGGLGSSRWGAYRKAEVVENCEVLDLFELAGDSGFCAGVKGVIEWRWGLRVSSVGYEVRGGQDSLYLVLRYSMARTAEEIDLPIRLQTTPANFGGVRWWGRCPLQRGNEACNRLVRKLYGPPFASYFGCRICHSLTYLSAQEHNNRFDRL